MSITELIALAAAALLAENLLLVRFLGADVALRQYGSLRRAVTTGLTVTLVMVLAAPLIWTAHMFLLQPFGLSYLRLVVFLLLIALLERILSAVTARVPKLAAALEGQFPMAAVNSAVLGGALLAVQENLGLGASLATAFFGGLGFTLSALLLASIRGRLTFSKCPKAFEGIPIALVTAGLLAMAFLGFSGLRL